MPWTLCIDPLAHHWEARHYDPRSCREDDKVILGLLGRMSDEDAKHCVEELNAHEQQQQHPPLH